MASRGSRWRKFTWAAVGVVAVAGISTGYSYGIFGGAGYVAGAEEIGISAQADAYTMSARPEEPAGTGSELLVGASDSGVSVSYLRFEVPGGAVVTSAKLRLTVSQVTNPALVEVSRVSSAWSEETLTAAEAPPFGSVLDTRRIAPGETTVEFNASLAVRQGGVYGFAVTTSASRSLVGFHSRESAAAVPSLMVQQDAVPTPSLDTPSAETPGVPSPTDPASPGDPSPTTSGEPAPSQSSAPGEAGQAQSCVTGALLVPSCGSLLGVAPGAHVRGSKTDALREFEAQTGRGQHIYHAYHRGRGELFPTPEEIELTSEPSQPRVLFLNWKPVGASWAEIAAGDRKTDAYLDELAEHLVKNYDRPFFFTVHHEPEDDVRARPDSGYTAADYAAMYRHVIQRLEAGGATKVVSVMVYMAYLKWTDQTWHSELYPGDDVVDWVGWDTYGYSDPGHGHGDFAELVNRVGRTDADWPGFYNWAAVTFPDKPLMVAEWGVWYSKRNPLHQAKVFDGAIDQMAHFPRIKAMVYFESANAEGRDSRVNVEPRALDSYRRLADSRYFSVDLKW